MKSILVLLFLCFFHFGLAQSYATDAGVIFLYPNDGETFASGTRRGSFSGTHILGDEIVEKLNNFEKAFVYFQKSSGAYAVEEKVILKKAIYNSIKKIDKYLVGQVGSGSLTKEAAARQYALLIDMSIKLTRYNTTQIENQLKKIKDENELIQFFERIKFQE